MSHAHSCSPLTPDLIRKGSSALTGNISLVDDGLFKNMRDIEMRIQRDISKSTLSGNEGLVSPNALSNTNSEGSLSPAPNDN